MVIPSLHGAAKAGLLDVLLDEYGWGRYDHMHSTVYEDLMRQARSRHVVRRVPRPHRLAVPRRPQLPGHARPPPPPVPAHVRLHLSRRGRLAALDGQLSRRPGDGSASTTPTSAASTSCTSPPTKGHQQVALEEVIAPVVRAEPAAAPEIARGVLEGHVVHALFSAICRDVPAGRLVAGGACDDPEGLVRSRAATGRARTGRASRPPWRRRAGLPRPAGRGRVRVRGSLPAPRHAALAGHAARHDADLRAPHVGVRRAHRRAPAPARPGQPAHARGSRDRRRHQVAVA